MKTKLAVKKIHVYLITGLMMKQQKHGMPVKNRDQNDGQPKLKMHNARRQLLKCINYRQALILNNKKILIKRSYPDVSETDRFAWISMGL